MVRVAVGLRPGARLCEPHQCPCGTKVSPEGTHGLACRRSTSRTSRHHTLNNLVWRALGRANVPAVKEPIGLLCSDGKRPDGLTQIPWQAGKCMTWDVTVADTLAESYIQATSSTAGAAAEGAAQIPVAGSHTHTRSFLWHLKLSALFMQRALLFSLNLVDASELALAICEKPLSYFNACH